MNAAIVLGFIFMLMTLMSVYLFVLSLSQAARARIMLRLITGQPETVVIRPLMEWLERVFARAGLGHPKRRLPLALAVWFFGMLVGYLLHDGVGLFVAATVPVVAVRVVVSIRYQRRVRKMVAQLPQLLDHSVRSLKSGRTLGDAILHGIETSTYPLSEAMARIRRNVQMGVSLPDAAQDFADLYRRDEFQLFALGLRVNHRYGGNASELLENLMRLIREREQGARQLRAMTGETRLTALVLALLPVCMVGYFLAVNPNYLMHMWSNSGGQTMLMVAFGMQVFGCLALWRMLRSI